MVAAPRPVLGIAVVHALFFRFLIVFLAAFALFGQAQYALAQFWTDQKANPVVLRVGDGTTISAGVGKTVTLLYFDVLLIGTGNQSSAFDSATGPNRLVTIANTVSEGNLTNSIDRGYVVNIGYDAANNTNGVNSPTINANRVIGWQQVTASGLTGAPQTGLPQSQGLAYNGSNGNPRSAISLAAPGTNTWTGGVATTASTGGMRYYNSNLLLTGGTTNTRSTDSYNGNLFFTSQTAGFVGVNMLSGGLATTSGQTAALVIASTSAYEFVFTSTGSAGPLDPATGARVAYVADDSSVANGGGVRRYDWNGTTWNFTYVINDGASGNRGLAGYFDADLGANVLYASSASGANLYRLVDTGAGSTFTTVATAGTNFVFRGVALAPAVIPEPTTVTLLGLAVAGVAAWRIRRWRAAQIAAVLRESAEPDDD
jgi:hypothetical protein